MSNVLQQFLDYNALCKLVSDGKTDLEISKEYHVHPSTVYRLRKQWGILRERNPEKYDWGMIQRMLECNMTYDDIAYVYSTNASRIIKYVSRKKRERA